MQELRLLGHYCYYCVIIVCFSTFCSAAAVTDTLAAGIDVCRRPVWRLWANAVSGCWCMLISFAGSDTTDGALMKHANVIDLNTRTRYPNRRFTLEHRSSRSYRWALVASDWLFLLLALLFFFLIMGKYPKNVLVFWYLSNKYLLLIEFSIIKYPLHFYLQKLSSLCSLLMY